MFHSPLHRMWDLTIHPFRGPNVLVGTRSSLELMWDLTIYPLRRPYILAGTPPDVHPL